MTQLEIYNINNVQPEGFKDAVISTRKPIFLGNQETKLVTENPIRLKDDDTYQLRDVQNVYYPKYKLQLIVDDQYWIEQIADARKVLVLQEGKPNQDIKVIEITREMLAKDAYKIEITYFDRTKHRVVENFKSSWIFETDLDLEYFTLKYGDNKYIYTRITPIEISPEPEQVTYNNNDINRLVKSILRQTKRYTFYLTQEELRDFQTNYHFYTCSLDGDLQADILPAPTITELGGWDIFKLEIDFIYKVQNVYI